MENLIKKEFKLTMEFIVALLKGKEVHFQDTDVEITKGTVIWGRSKQDLLDMYIKATEAPRYMFWLAKLLGRTQIAIDTVNNGTSADGVYKMVSKTLWGKTYIMSFVNITEGSNEKV